MPPSLVKCLIHHAGLVCRSQESLHLSSSPSISLPAHVSLSQAAKSWMTDCQPRCAVEGGPAKTGPWMVEGEVVHVSQSSAWPWGSSRCSTAPRQEWTRPTYRCGQQLVSELGRSLMVTAPLEQISLASYPNMPIDLANKSNLMSHQK